MTILISFFFFNFREKRKLDFINFIFRFFLFLFHSITHISTPISRIPTLIPRFTTLIPHVPTLILSVPIIPFIQFPDSPFRLLQLAKKEL